MNIVRSEVVSAETVAHITHDGLGYRYTLCAVSDRGIEYAFSSLRIFASEEDAMRAAKRRVGDLYSRMLLRNYFGVPSKYLRGVRDRHAIDRVVSENAARMARVPESRDAGTMVEVVW